MAHGSARRARRTKLRAPKGLQLEVGARRASRLLYFIFVIFFSTDLCKSLQGVIMWTHVTPIFSLIVELKITSSLLLNLNSKCSVKTSTRNTICSKHLINVTESSALKFQKEKNQWYQSKISETAHFPQNYFRVICFVQNSSSIAMIMNNLASLVDAIAISI